jgi:circadian clock protein KaiB
MATQASDSHDETFHDLTLFVSGASDLAARAIEDAANICDRHLQGRYHLSVIDVHDDPCAVRGRAVLVTPTLIKRGPPPARRVVGDISHAERVIRMLGLPVAHVTPQGS